MGLVLEISNFFITKTSLANKWMRKKIPACSHSAIFTIFLQSAKFLLCKLISWKLVKNLYNKNAGKWIHLWMLLHKGYQLFVSSDVAYVLLLELRPAAWFWFRPSGIGWQFPGDFHSSGIRGTGEWQFYIPRGLRKIKSNPWGPLGFSGILFTN